MPTLLFATAAGTGHQRESQLRGRGNPPALLLSSPPAFPGLTNHCLLYTQKMPRYKPAEQRKIAKGRTKLIQNFETNVERVQRLNDACWVLGMSKREFIEKAIDNYYELHQDKIEAVTSLVTAN
ncbi:MAG: hypothetical protein F6K28_49540 [Microcoleus sp. SIO2G3]|nr:hypothetical protein [Microcoleus sp. SIO2G3]